jgi:hypothetical protein
LAALGSSAALQTDTNITKANKETTVKVNSAADFDMIFHSNKIINRILSEQQYSEFTTNSKTGPTTENKDRVSTGNYPARRESLKPAKCAVAGCYFTSTIEL